MTQLSLFDNPAPAPPMSHRNDPESSSIAADNLVRSGAHIKQREQVFAALADWERINAGSEFPYPTSAELAARMDVERAMPARRLPELEEAGRVAKVRGPDGKPLLRKCGVRYSMATTWRIVR